MVGWTCTTCGYRTDEINDMVAHECEGDTALALGHLHCARCGRWGTVLGYLVCQECLDAGSAEKEAEGTARFTLGRIVATPGALATMERLEITASHLLARHVRGDWGDIDDEDKRENEFAVNRELRIMSGYGGRSERDRLWIITEADRSVTTILCPEEY